MEKLIIGTKKTVSKLLYGVSKLFVNFNKRIKGVRKSKNFYPIEGNKENNFQVCFPLHLYKSKSLPCAYGQAQTLTITLVSSFFNTIFIN